MTTTGHIVKAMRAIHAERDRKDWVTAVVDVPSVGGGVVDRLVELGLPVTPHNGGEAPFDKERFVNARAEDYWNLREIFETGNIDIDPDDDNQHRHASRLRSGPSISACHLNRPLGLFEKVKVTSSSRRLSEENSMPGVQWRGEDSPSARQE